MARLKSALFTQHSALILICLLAFAFRLGPLFGNRFHPDEALFSTWALKIARGENLLLTGLPVDKPPLLIYLTALSYFIFGQNEIAARLPNLIASVVSVVLVWRLAISQLGTGKSGISKLVTSTLGEYQPANQSPQDQFTNNQFSVLLPPLLFALSPFAISFAPTAFLDPLMVMFGLASLVAASRGRAGWAGILLGLSFATKVQGLFFAPLIPIFWAPHQLSRLSYQPSVQGHIVSWGRFSLSRVLGHPFWRFSLACLSILLGVIIWDRFRGGLPFWVQQSINYGGIRVIYPSELRPRLTGWYDFLPYFFGPIVGALGLIGLPLLFRHDLTRAARTHAAFIDLWLFIYSIGFLAFHWLLAFPVWDRYLLILVPIAALLFGRAIYHLVTVFRRDTSSHHPVKSPLFFSMIILVMLPFSITAARSGYPVGGDHGANDGIEQVSDYLKALPSGTVVYDHWLAWELGYYQGDGFAYLAYFDTPVALADDLRVFGGQNERYIIFPGHESPDKVIDAIRRVGYTLKPVFTTQDRFGQTSFTIYQIDRPEQ